MKTSAFVILASTLIASSLVSTENPTIGHFVKAELSSHKKLDKSTIVNIDQLNLALKAQMGLPFKWGGNSPESGGFDSSGLVSYVYKEMGFNLKGNAKQQYMKTEEVRFSEIVPGDLLFWATYKKDISHVGIYLGKNKFVTVSHKQGVSEHAISDWEDKYELMGIKRVSKSNLISQE